MNGDRPLRVLYSFPHKIGADRICYTAWQQVRGLALAGADVLVFPGAVAKPLAPNIKVNPTLARGKVGIPYRAIGSMRAFVLHDWVVSRRLEKLASAVDIVHAWPLGACRTLRAAARLGIPTVLERPNAHTRFAMEAVKEECERLGVALPANHEHAYNEEKLRIEEEEYHLATRLLCPSDFVMKTFVDKGFTPSQLVRHTYGFDPATYHPSKKPRDPKRGLQMLFVGVCAVRKGVHYALQAWLRSTAHETGTFLIAGEFLPSYKEKLAPMLSHPSVHVLGHRNDVPQLMRDSDLLVLPSIEEGYGLVIAEAMGSGCVPLASEACTEECKHMECGLVHRVGDVETLTRQISSLDQDRTLLSMLCANSLSAAPGLTWSAAGYKLLDAYRETIAQYRGTANLFSDRADDAYCVQ